MNILIIKKIMKAKIRQIKPSYLLMISCLLISGHSQAAKSDLTKEITIKSQRQAADLKNKIASYLDNVSITQGTIAITADIVKVYSTTDKITGIKQDTYLAKGKPATFEQQLEDGSLIQLQADEVTYLPTSNTITVSGNAVVKQAGSEVSGNKISYNLLTEQLEAQSLNNQSVTTVLKPTVLKKQKEFHEQSKLDEPIKQGDVIKDGQSVK